MMIYVNRFLVSDKGTFSTVIVGDQHLCGLECPWRDNRPSVSCIPAGVYLLKPHTSPKFGGVHAFQGGTVSIYENEATERSAVLWHAANWVTQLRGCLATGMEFTFDEGGRHNGVSNSRKSLTAYRELAPLTEEHVVVVKWDF